MAGLLPAPPGRPHRCPRRGLRARLAAGPAPPRRVLRAPLQRHRRQPLRRSTAGRGRRPFDPLPGRHDPRKGLDLLLDAVAALPRSVTVWVAGDGPATAVLRERHRSDRRISWPVGSRSTTRSRHLRTASVLCAPSRHGESFGMVLLEAMAARTPAVASDVPGYRSLNERSGAIFLVPPGDPRSPTGCCACCPTTRLRGGPPRPRRRARASLLDGPPRPPLRRD